MVALESDWKKSGEKRACQDYMAGDGIDVVGSMEAHGAGASLDVEVALDTVAVLDNEAAHDATAAPDTVDAHRVPDEVARVLEGQISYGLADSNDEGHAEDLGASEGLELWSQLEERGYFVYLEVDYRPGYRKVWGLWKNQTRAQSF